MEKCLEGIAAAYVESISGIQEMDLDTGYDKSKLLVVMMNKDKNREYFSNEDIVHIDGPDTDLAAAIRVNCGSRGWLRLIPGQGVHA